MKKKNALTGLLLTTLLMVSSCSSSCDHEWIYTDNGDGTHLAVCSKDCTHIKNEPHHFNEGTIIVKPTEISPGKKEYECKECKYTYSETLAPTGQHVFDQEVVDDKYLYKELSNKSKVYYKSSKDGAFGDPDYLFERSPFISDERLKDYTEVKYLDSGINSYIDTGIKANNRTRIKTKAYGSESHSIFSGTANDKLDLAIMNLTFGDYDGDGAQEGIFYYKDHNQPSPYSDDLAYRTHTFDFNRNKVFVDGNFYYGFEEEQFEDVSNIFLFARNSEFGVAHDVGTGMRIYDCQIYQDDILVRDFIPVYQNNNHQLGMFDFVDYKFYPMISNDKKETYHRNEYRQDELPEGYKQVLYIENDAMNRIDAGLVVSGLDEGRMYGIIQADKFDPKVEHWFGANYWLEYKVNDCANINQQYYIEAKCGKAMNDRYVNDTRHTLSLYPKEVITNPNVKIGIFAFGNKNNEWCNDEFTCFKLYSLKIELNGKIERDFIPVIRTIDNTPGLFDVIENKFYEAENVGKTTSPLKYKEEWEDIVVLGNARKAPEHGSINCHLVDEGKIVKEATPGENGKIVYTCQICHKEFEEAIDNTAYEVEFIHSKDFDISIYKDYDPLNAVISDTGYTRNKDSFNYSKDNTILIFKINSNRAFDIKDIEIDGDYKTVTKLDTNFFRIDGAISNLKVNISN